MTEAVERLRRYLEDELDDCRAADVAERLAALDDIEARASAHATEDAAVFAALGNDTRYGLVRALVTAGERLCVCELRPLFEVSESAVSHALSELSAAGLVTAERDGKWRYYEATPRAEALLAAVDATREAA